MNQNKGQVTIDFLVTLVIIMTLFLGVTLPLMNDSLQNSSLLQSSEVITTAREKIKMVNDMLQDGGRGSQKWISLRAPVDCPYYFTQQNLNGYMTSIILANCTGDSLDMGTQTVGPATIGISYTCPDLACDTVNIGGMDYPGIKGGNKVEIKIKKIF